jgi:hypothetical protein
LNLSQNVQNGIFLNISGFFLFILEYFEYFYFFNAFLIYVFF